MSEYTTWNPSDKNADITLSNGNLTAKSTASGHDCARTILSKSSGKWYWEITVDYDSGSIGSAIGLGIVSSSLGSALGTTANEYAYQSGGKKKTSASAVDYGDSWTTDDIIGVAFDRDAGKVWFSKNGIWQASGDPANGTGEAFSGINDTMFGMFSLYYTDEQLTANFGASAFSYSVPSGFNSGLYDLLAAGITDGVGMADTYASFVLAAIIAEAFGVADTYDLDTPYRDITDGCGIDDVLIRSFETFNSITDGVGIADAMAGVFEIFAAVTNNAGIADTYAKSIEAVRSITDGNGIVDLHEVIRVFNKTQSETLSSWDTLKWGWHKSIADSMAIAETVSKILGIPVKDWLVLTDTQTNTWKGSEAVSDSLFILDISKAVKVYADSIADGMAIVDAVNIALELMIADILTCTDTVLNIGTFQHSIADSMTLEDIVKRAFPKSVSDSFAITDTSLIDFLVLLQISDSLAITETTTPGLTISQTIADALDVLDTVTIKQLLQELIQDGLNIDVSVVVDGEIWECWVLNTSAFHPSVYSGYDYNSFALFNNVAYGCKSDGIYELAGDTDNGTAFHSGIILPETRFGLAHNKRFRKAYFGVSGNDLVMKMKTDNGWRTFRMTDTEMSLTRDLKGRKWEISLEDFDELDSISLIPVILSRK